MIIKKAVSAFFFLAILYFVAMSFYSLGYLDGTQRDAAINIVRTYEQHQFVTSNQTEDALRALESELDTHIVVASL